jgi:5,10-methylenetetrahydromethanopterin reductase
VVGRLDPTISGEPRLEQFAVAGTPEAVAAHADALYAAGAKRVEFGTPQGRTTREGVDLLCEEVLPLLRR